MKALLGIVRTTIVGGLLFLLPFGFLLVALDKVYEKAAPLGAKLHAALFPSSHSIIGPAVLAILFLALTAFLAGAFAQTIRGKRLFKGLEKATLGRIPLYTYLRPALDDLAGTGTVSDRVADAKIVEVRTEEMTTFGVLIELTPDNRAVVFFPDAPSAMSGSVALVSQERVHATTMTRAEFFVALRSFGTGIGRKRVIGGGDTDPATVGNVSPKPY